MNELLLKTSIDWPQRWLRLFRRPFRQYAIRKELVGHTTFAERLLTQLARDGGVELATFYIRRVQQTRSGVIVAFIDRQSALKPALVLKLPLTVKADQSTNEHRQALIGLRQLPALQSFATHIPRPIAWGSFEERPYYLETALAGESCVHLVRKQVDPTALLQNAANLIMQLHKGTMCRLIIDDVLFAQLVGDDLSMLRQLVLHWPDAALLERKLQALEILLRRGMYQQELPLSWSHGDFWPGNILIESATGQPKGIIDWDRARPLQQPLLDLLHLLAYTRKIRLRTQLGEEIVNCLLPATFEQHKYELIDSAVEALGLPSTFEFLQASVWLYWVRFAAANLSRYPAFQADQRWLSKNVFLVLKEGLR